VTEVTLEAPNQEQEDTGWLELRIGCENTCKLSDSLILWGLLEGAGGQNSQVQEETLKKMIKDEKKVLRRRIERGKERKEKTSILEYIKNSCRF
jgi:hypothetical protein